MITQQKLKELFDYNQETGVFTNKINRNSRALIGNKVGCVNSCGYLIVGLNGKIYLLHRLAWLYIYGEWPNIIDHINGIKTDNRIENLKNGNKRQNNQNRKKNRNGKLVGCTYNKKCKRYQSYIRILGKFYSLGYYETEQLAHEAYLNKLKEIEYDYK